MTIAKERHPHDQLILFLLFMILSFAALCAAQTTDEDLDVGWIHRLPELDYVTNSPQPDVDGWPVVGDDVTWQAMVKNWFSSDKLDVAYQWLLDGNVVDEGVVDLAAGTHTAVDFVWPWTFDRHELTFAIDPDHQIPELSEANNELMVYTDAISVGFWVEQSVYDYFHQYQHELGVGILPHEPPRHVGPYRRPHVGLPRHDTRRG